ncbi:amino acid adenylation domain-containing protein [Streptomyces sp. 4503]|uniref:Amino acid adenylation domain-containing protein n=1 Tax=Streptomyces niphimycinicus TaxID=2842201 RepID=A0ABS6C8P0_9ACTN|nr:non-ribosomal peptide synthetase [Streptomyces niphimycinicus]MBU3863227.1 amino acid adenylation domain-containing protein [Streptomyces niphimycinicus]
MLIHELVARQAASTPDAVAVVDGSSELTYRELDRRADRVARLLARAGAGPDSPVGVRLPRGHGMVVALLASWKAAAAYVPLDPADPWNRTETVLADSGAGVLLVHECPERTVPGCAILLLGTEPVADADLAPLAPAGRASGDHPAYLICTSGSTGRPKAVVISHDAIANTVRWRVATHRLTRQDRILQKTPLTFDAAGWEIFAPLVSGGTVVLAPPGAERDPAAMVRAVAEQRITVLQVVPSVLRALVEEPGWDDCADLRVLSSAGEPLHAELAQRFLRAVEGGAGDVEVWNTYGPTECCIDITAHRFDPLQRAGLVPIGAPIAGMHVVVDEDGEIRAGGPGVAQGYRGSPALTAERFVPDPTGRPGTRLYRTGDLGRRRADGGLDYLGRVDHQVKIDGVRIEPGEVTTALVEHPGVLQAAVTAYQAPNGATRLAAYVRLRAGTAADELAGFLRGRLPASFVPAAFVELDALPTTSSGKVDQGALPAVEHGGDRRASAASEELVAGLWRELLGVQDIGRNDGYFQLGGSSLQLVRLANRLTEATGRSVRPADLLSATTVAAQAALLEETTARAEAVRPVGRDAALPLSFGQHRIWLQHAMDDTGREWVSGIFLPVPEGAGHGTIRVALDGLVERHEALRTRFVVEAGEPVQYVDPPAPVELRVVDGARDRVGAVLDGEARRGFDLEHGPLLRALLFRVPSGPPTLVLLIHHIACDGWSSAVLEREFQHQLTGLLAGRPEPLRALAVQYADFAVWQREQLTDDVLTAELDHWRQALDGSVPLSPHPDRPRPRHRDARGAVVGLTIPPSVVEALDALAQGTGATPFMTMLTAYATLLARHTAQWDVPVGAPVAGRERPELEGVVGFFLNSLVLRCRLARWRTFAESLAAVRDVCADAFAHQGLPFDRLVADLAPDRDLSRTPLYQVALDFHGAELTGAPDDDADLAVMLDASRVAKTDLTLYLRRRPDGSMLALFEYATALYDEATVTRLAERFRLLLRSVAADPGIRLDALDITPDAERQDLARWSETPAPPFAGTVLDLFERRAARTPDALALCAAGTSLSFAETDRRADGLAGQLRARGAGPGAVVGVLLDRGVDLPVALLAVWKTGAAYLPLDPEFPADRVGYMLRDAGARILVTEEKHERRLGGVHDAEVVHASRPGDAPPVRLARTDAPDLPAYVIYTSGSTGRPKGVVVTHAGLAGHVRWAVDELAGPGTGGAPLFSSVAFDLVVPNLWAALVAGRPLHLLPQDLDLAELGAHLLSAAPFAFIKLTPGHLEILAEQIPRERVPELTGTIVVAGEALPPVSAEWWRQALGPGRLINEYGPTEGTVGACVFPVTAPVDGTTVPIGRPLPGVTLRVLDESSRQAPVEAVGELYVGGAGVAQAYANSPALTAERFLPDPYGVAGARMYRTGDLARVLPGGDIDFVGRRDEQIKIRGYRVEPGEIAAVLRGHPEVRDAVVTVAESGLTGYVVTARAVPAQDLIAYCARHLPPYMVPVHVVAIDAVPLTPNGKLDRAALPAAQAVPLAAPNGIVEERIAELFTTLLGVPVGAHSNFFGCGGNSILAIRLAAAIQADFEVNVPMRTVLERGTVAELAAAVEEAFQAEVDRMSDEELMAATLQGEEESVE